MRGSAPACVWNRSGRRWCRRRCRWNRGRRCSRVTATGRRVPRRTATSSATGCTRCTAASRSILHKYTRTLYCRRQSRSSNNDIYKKLICRREAARRSMPGLKTLYLAYFQQLNRLNLESLELRRLRQDLIITYKMVFGLVDLNVHDFFRCSFEKVRRGHGYKLFLHTCHSFTHFNSFAYRVMRTWDVLPHDDTDFSCLQVSKFPQAFYKKMSKGIF